MALLETLQDDFSDPVASNAKWNEAGSIIYDSGRALLTGGTTSPTIVSANTYEFGGGHNTHFHAKVTPNAGTTTGVEMRVFDPTSSARLTITLDTGTLNGNYNTAAGVNTTRTLGTYNAATMAHWRIRCAAGIAYWGFSADGITWTEPESMAFSFNSTTIRAHIRLSSTSSARTVSVDDVNIGAGTVAAPTGITEAETLGNPAATYAALTAEPDSITDAETVTGPGNVYYYPPLELLRDDFTATSVNGARWSQSGSAGTAANTTGGTLNITTTAGQVSPFRIISSVTAYNPAESYLYAKVTPSTFTSQTAFLRVKPASGSEVFSLIRSGANLITSGTNAAGASIGSASVTYDPATMVWWRLRFTAGSIYWDTAPDGLTWTNRLVRVYTPALPTYLGEVGCGWSGTSSNSTVRFDNVNIMPPTPAGITDAETLGEPTLTQAAGEVTPDGIEDPETLGEPELSFAAPATAEPESITDPETLGNPAVITFLVCGPGNITDPETLGEPELSIAAANTLYPADITDPDFVGEPDLILDEFPAVHPGTIADPEMLGEPDLVFVREKDNWDYGAGVYGHGPYYGYIVPTPPACIDNFIYGTGTYGCGIYYGYAIPTVDPTPLFGDVAPYAPPLHILGVGPWSPTIVWRGLPNYGIGKGKLPARPALALPPATSKGFTLRLNEGSEARIDLAMRRGDAVIIDEMDTDLWWRRKDPRTRILEVIGRFNCNNIELGTSDTGVNLAAQFEDYQTILGARTILKYLNPGFDPPTTQWKAGTLVTDILAWALPDNTGLDLSEVTGDSPYPLGKTTMIYHLPPGTLIADVMDDLEAASQNSWEWWIETPADVNQAPKLRFVIGTRGADKGVTLFDVGSGPTPIASWTRNSAADNYANTLYHSGGGDGTGANAAGGVVVKIPTHIDQYGQRDGQDGSATNAGNKDQLIKGAEKKLAKLSDRTPTYTIKLTQGFWRGRNHIDVGDTVRVVLRLGKDVTDLKYRVTEIAVTVDENSYEDVTLTLGRPLASADPRSKRSPLMRFVRKLKNYSRPPGAVDIPEDDD